MSRMKTLDGYDRSKEAIAFLDAVAEVSRRHGFVFWIETHDQVVVTRSVTHEPGARGFWPTVENQNDTPELVEDDD